MPHPITSPISTSITSGSNDSSTSTPSSPKVTSQQQSTILRPLPRAKEVRPESGVIDSRIGPEAAQPSRRRLLHSRLPSISRIRSRRIFQDRSLPSRSTTLQDSEKTAASRSIGFGGRSSHPDLPDPDFGTDKALSVLSLNSQDSLLASSPRQKASSIFTEASEGISSQTPDQAKSKEQGSTTDVTTPQTNPPTDGVATKDSRNMHQTSSRLLRMTDDDRPFTRVRILPTQSLLKRNVVPKHPRYTSSSRISNVRTSGRSAGESDGHACCV